MVGASYSHADILKFDNLSLSRPQTPPGAKQRSSPGPGTSSSPPPRRTYTSFLSETNNAWGHGEDELGDEQLGFDEDEDEFGLPSIATMRRKGKRLSSRTEKDPGGSQTSLPSRNNVKSPMNSWTLDNGDVADTRAIPTYPSAKKAEGKILRPQYKGKHAEGNHGLEDVILLQWPNHHTD